MIDKEYAKLRADGHTAKNALAIAKYNAKMHASPFYHACDGETVEYKGREFTVRLPYDIHGEKPWKQCDPLGEVREHRYSSAWSESKLPAGWVWINKPDSRHYGYAYDRASALAETAKWHKGIPDARCVDAEIERFQRWLNNDWHYIGVCLELGDDNESIWGVEDDCPEYIAELLEEHADTLIERAADKARRAEMARCFL